MLVRLLFAFFVFIAIPAVSFSAEKLIFAVDLIRHGDRTPISPLPAVKHQWREGLGQLTAEGMRQEYEMGRRFRKLYVEKTQLLPSRYQRDSIYIFSTDYERTLMSAQSLLMGLYPPGTGPSSEDTGKSGLPNAHQPIPVHSAPTKYDHVIIHRIDDAEAKALMHKYVYSTPEWLQKENALKSYFPRWSELTGYKISKLQHLEHVGDALYIHRIHHAPMPAGLTEDEIETIIQAGDWAFMAEERPLPVARAYSSQIMSNIARYLKRSSEHKSVLRYVLLSAHDSTIASALSFMGAPLSKSPHYASDLNFALYESGSNNYVVKVTYNGVPVSIPACASTVCPLQKFLDLATGNT